MHTTPIPFLATKILPPRRARGTVERPRLAALADDIAERRLTLVKAPAGFGKTTLALAWADALRLAGGSVAWLTLEADDDESSRFLYYVTAAIRRTVPTVGDALSGLAAEGSTADVEAAAALLVNDLAGYGGEVFLFLDDFHCIADPAIHAAMSFVIRHAPPNFHLVLLGRGEPPLPLAKLRAGGDLVELDATELRFDLDETRRFLEKSHPGALDAANVRTLHATTEGWAAALRIASLSLGSQRHPERYLRNLSAASRPIGSFLTELLDELPGGLVDFMLKVSVADRFCAPLAAALTGSAQAGVMIEGVERRQLFLTPLGEDGHWFAFHQLFREHLQKRLQSQGGEDVIELHRRAYRWYAARELWSDAVRHALSAGDAECALGWIEQCAMGLVERGDIFTLLNWERQLHAALLKSPLRLRLALAWASGLAMAREDALRRVEGIEAESAGADPEDASGILWECRALRAVLAGLGDDSETGGQLAAECLRREHSNPWLAIVLTNVACFSHLQAGRWEAFQATPRLGDAPEENARYLFSSIYRLALLGMGDLVQARFAEAAGTFEEALRLATREGGIAAPAALPAVVLASIRYEQNRLVEAERLLDEWMDIATAAGFLDCLRAAYTTAARLAALRGETDQALAVLERAEDLGRNRGWPRLESGALLERVFLLWRDGRRREVAACAGRLDRLCGSPSAAGRHAHSEIARDAALAKAYHALAGGAPGEAADLLDSLWTSALASRHFYPAIRVGVALALARKGRGDADGAAAVFLDTVELAMPAGIERAILDYGPAVAELAAAAGPSGDKPLEFSPKLADFLERMRTSAMAVPRPPAASLSFVPAGESLSPRERHIVELIAAGKSNKEIARTLNIGAETVKTHLKSVFAKLGVETRTEAAIRAHRLGLVGSK